ncbi:MAG: hypothetical protein PVI30_18185 [Myxococcales bacterium]|jgi:hypothetical protein
MKVSDQAFVAGALAGAAAVLLLLPRAPEGLADRYGFAAGLVLALASSFMLHRALRSERRASSPDS